MKESDRQNRFWWMAGFVATTIPLIVDLRSDKMDWISRCVCGTGLLIIWIAFVREPWASRRLAKLAENAIVRGVGAALIVFGAGCWAFAAYKPSPMDPEAAENKYVRVTPAPSPDPRFKYAVVIEFGVKKVNTEGFIIGVEPYGEDQWHWYGMPGGTNRQTEFDMIHGGPEEGILWIRMPEFAITPRRSYYLCLMGQTEREIEPKDILYFAIAGNAASLVSSAKERIGRQFQPIGWTQKK